jgi:hypothetical protein
VPPLIRILGQFAQDRHWKNSQKRYPEKVLARSGHHAAEFRLANAKIRRLSQINLREAFFN